MTRHAAGPRDPAPDSLPALVEYLGRNPSVDEWCADSRVRGFGEVLFLRAAGGGLWFRTPAGAERFLPVDCGMTAAESGFAFHPWGFEVTKFGVTIAYTYLPPTGRGG